MIIYGVSISLVWIIFIFIWICHYNIRNIIRIKMPTPSKKTWYNEYPNTTYYSISMHKQNLVSGIFRFFCIFSFYGKVTPSKTFYVPWVLRLILHVIGNLYFTRINLFYRHRFPHVIIQIRFITLNVVLPTLAYDLLP